MSRERRFRPIQNFLERRRKSGVRFLNREPSENDVILDVDVKKPVGDVRGSSMAINVQRNATPISKSSETGYCYTCIRDHLHKVTGLLREADKQFTRDGVISPGIRRKVALAESELSAATTEHVWNVKLDNPRDQIMLKQIGSKLSRLKKTLENTQLGFEHPGIKPRGGPEDVRNAIEEAGKIMGQVYDAMVECPTCTTMDKPHMPLHASPVEDPEDCPTCSEAIGIGWSMGIAKRLNMPDIDLLEQEVREERIPPEEAMDKMIAFAESSGKSDDVKDLKEIRRMMYTPLSELE